ncbi:unnamed protein product, partial [Didymodactylos carnosus]
RTKADIEKQEKEKKSEQSETAMKRAQSDKVAHSLYYQDSDFAVVERLKQIAEK